MCSPKVKFSLAVGVCLALFLFAPLLSGERAVTAAASPAKAGRTVTGGTVRSAAAADTAGSGVVDSPWVAPPARSGTGPRNETDESAGDRAPGDDQLPGAPRGADPATGTGGRGVGREDGRGRTGLVQVGDVVPPSSGLLLNVAGYTLYYFQQSRLVKEYPIAIGQAGRPTPLGDFKVVEKLIDPVWWPPDGGGPVPPGPDNPLGSRWLGLDLKGYGVHGTNNPASIGLAISLGCVRLYNADIEELFTQVPRGFPVRIVHRRAEVRTDPETGERDLYLYPDVYRTGTNLWREVEETLLAAGLPLSLAAGDRVKSVVDRAAKGATTPVRVALGSPVSYDGVYLATGRREKDTFLIPLRPVAEAMGLPVGWIPEKGVATVAGQEVPVFLRENRSFIPAGQAEVLLGVRVTWDEAVLAWDLRRTDGPAASYAGTSGATIPFMGIGGTASGGGADGAPATFVRTDVVTVPVAADGLTGGRSEAGQAGSDPPLRAEAVASSGKPLP